MFKKISIVSILFWGSVITMAQENEKLRVATLIAQNQPKQGVTAPTQDDNSETVFANDLEIQKYDLYDKKVTWNQVAIPNGWRLPTRKELKFMCKNKKKIGNFKTNRYSNYFTGEFNENVGKIYIRSFDDCEESVENLKSEEGWVRLVKDR